MDSDEPEPDVAPREYSDEELAVFLRKDELDERTRETIRRFEAATASDHPTSQGK